MMVKECYVRVVGNDKDSLGTVLLGSHLNKLLDIRTALLCGIVELDLVGRQVALNSTPNFLAICLAVVL